MFSGVSQQQLYPHVGHKRKSAMGQNVYFYEQKYVSPHHRL